VGRHPTTTAGDGSDKLRQVGESSLTNSILNHTPNSKPRRAVLSAVRSRANLDDANSGHDDADHCHAEKAHDTDLAQAVEPQA
jgi:hypothetical protein